MKNIGAPYGLLDRWTNDVVIALVWLRFFFVFFGLPLFV
jgi:hypothetical protein